MIVALTCPKLISGGAVALCRVGRGPRALGVAIPENSCRCMPCNAETHSCWEQCHTFLGTVTYMSPERINSEPYSFPSDIWSAPCQRRCPAVSLCLRSSVLDMIAHNRPRHSATAGAWGSRCWSARWGATPTTPAVGRCSS